MQRIRLRLTSCLFGFLIAGGVVAIGQQAAPYVLSPASVSIANPTFAGTVTATTGPIISGTYVQVANTSSVISASRGGLSFTADGLFVLVQNSFATVGYQINAGTAAPSVTTCGTGAIAAHSNNMAGSFSTTGATTCTLTFGAPAWSFTPFCTFTEKTTAGPYRISAESTTAITITGFTSGDSFTYVCGGGAF